MDEYYNVHQALKILNKHYVTDSQQVLTRFIREGRLTATKQSYGYIIKKEDLLYFINHYHNGIVEIMEVYDQYLEELEYPLSVSEKKKVKKVDKVEHEDKLTTSFWDEKLNMLFLKMDELISSIQTLTTSSETDRVNTSVQENQQNSSSNQNTAEQTIQKKESSQYKKSKKKPYDEFLKNLKSTLKNIEHYRSEQEIKDVYSIYYDENSLIKEGIYDETKDIFVCPKTQMSNSNMISLLKDSVSSLLSVNLFNEVANPEKSEEEQQFSYPEHTHDDIPIVSNKKEQKG